MKPDGPLRSSDPAATSPAPASERRAFLRRAAFAGAGVALGAGVIATPSCGPSGPIASDVARRAKDYDPDLDCTDTSDLYEAERSIRVDNEYVASTDHPTQRCFNCTYFVEAEAPKTCATCDTVPGPIHPLGRCKAWVWRRG